MQRKLVWLPTVHKKLIQFRNEKFSPEETFDFIIQLILETESILEKEDYEDDPRGVYLHWSRFNPSYLLRKIY